MRKQSLRNRKWTTLTVSDIADVNPTMSLSGATDGSIPLYEMAAIDEANGELREAQMVPISSGRSGRTKFRNGDVLFAKITPCVQNGKSALVKGVPGDLALGSSEFYVLRAGSTILPEFLFIFVRQRRVVEAAVASFTGTSGRQRVPRGFWDTLHIPVPPLPVQERIVEILAKADDIRRKRRQAMELAAKILPAQFVGMFGDPLDNSRGYPMCHLRDLCTPRSGGTPSKKNKEFWTNGTIPWVSPEDMKKPVIFDVEDKVTEVAIGNRELIQPGSVLVVVRGMILQHTAPVALVGAPLTFNQDMKALIPHEDIPGEFLFWALKCSSERLLHLVDTASHGTKKIDTDRLLNLRMIRPQASAMQHFARIHRQYFEGADRRHFLSTDSRRLFDALLSDAFTGELTAEWEQANADLITKKQDLQENVPRLALLAMLSEATRRREAGVLVTALMKYLFLLQMDANGRRRLYQFIPYHYGPFAKELYADLERLQEQGLITVQNDAEEDKNRITTADPQRIEAALGEIPDDLREDVCSILDEYGELDHNRLLKTVYKKYPAYAKNSRLLKKGTKKAVKPSRRPK